MKIYAPWEKALKRVLTPFEHFIHTQTTTGLVLIIATVIALTLANTPLLEFYQNLIHTKISFEIGPLKLSHSLQHWINDGLMAIFFFMVGLEIKREILIGELSSIQNASLPIIAAIGGMVLPALIYVAINQGGDGIDGWGIPMATDIAFAISALVLLGNRVPPALFTFLVALAIVDDLGAVLVIAIFYTQTINLIALSLAAFSFLVLLTLNRTGIHAILPYFLVGTIMWFFMLESGVHATIAGVIAAIAIPSQPKFAPVNFTRRIKDLLDEYDNYPVATDHTTHDKQKSILQNINRKINDVCTPSATLERKLHLPVGLLIIPLFALVNAGVTVEFSSISKIILEPISLGITLGLIVGKVLGIAGLSWIAVKLKIAKLPNDTSMRQIFGVSFLGGIGFTMSIFIADLAFNSNENFIFQAKIGILFASLVSGLIGYFWLRNIKKS